MIINCCFFCALLNLFNSTTRGVVRFGNNDYIYIYRKARLTVKCYMTPRNIRYGGGCWYFAWFLTLDKRLQIYKYVIRSSRPAAALKGQRYLIANAVSCQPCMIVRCFVSELSELVYSFLGLATIITYHKFPNQFGFSMDLFSLSYGLQ